jgi:hypothetical protein
MNCTHVREFLPGFAYNELSANEAQKVKDHLAQCSICRGEYASLQELQNMLDSVPAPAVNVSVPALFRRGADLQDRRARRWRRAAYALGAVAAGVLVILFSRLEIRFGSDQIVVRWGDTSAGSEAQAKLPIDHSPPVLNDSPYTPASEAELQPLRGLIYALDSGLDQLSRDVEARDRRQQQNIVRLQEQVTQLRVAFQRQMATYLADSSNKGDNP